MNNFQIDKRAGTIKHHGFLYTVARHWVVAACCFFIFLLLVLNFLTQYIPVFKPEYKTRIGQNDVVRFDKFRKIPKVEASDFLDHLNFNRSSSNLMIRKCETVHVGIVCSGARAHHFFNTMLKSIYFHRNHPLHFHIMVNKFSEKILKVLFHTWDVPQVNVSYYYVSNYIQEVRWVPNSHYSGVYGLLKLIFPKIIPLNVTDKLIVIDTDLTFMGDIYQLWDLFKNFRPDQILGLVENQSNYYLRLFSNPWPALGRGYNTGVILYYLRNLKEINWAELWTKVAKKTATSFGATQLADQDIINALIKESPDLLFSVPCEWNVQLSDFTHSDQCYANNSVKIVHWNSPKKFNVINKDGEYFRNVFKSYFEINGNLFRRQLFDCSNSTRNVTHMVKDVCSDFHRAQNTLWRTWLFLREYKYMAFENDVTFVAHLSYERLYMIEEVTQYWKGPMSFTFYVTDPELESCLNFIDGSSILQDRTNIAYHAVFKDGDLYPINELRNVGLRNVNTPLVFLADVDFIPMFGMYASLKRYFGRIQSTAKKAFVVPAFETQRYRSLLPKNKKELIKMLDNKSIFTFRYDVWPVGHAPVNYTKWRNALTAYEVKWQPDFEPYVIVSSKVTEYDRRFLGFGWNKVSHIMELQAQGYQFIVLPSIFIIHKPHAPSYDIGKFRNSPIYRMCLQNLKDDFVSSLEKKYGVKFDPKTNKLIFEA